RRVEHDAPIDFASTPHAVAISTTDALILSLSHKVKQVVDIARRARRRCSCVEPRAGYSAWRDETGGQGGTGPMRSCRWPALTSTPDSFLGGRTLLSALLDSGQAGMPAPPAQNPVDGATQHRSPSPA